MLVDLNGVGVDNKDHSDIGNNLNIFVFCRQ